MIQVKLQLEQILSVIISMCIIIILQYIFHVGEYALLIKWNTLVETEFCQRNTTNKICTKLVIQVITTQPAL